MRQKLGKASIKHWAKPIDRHLYHTDRSALYQHRSSCVAFISRLKGFTYSVEGLRSAIPALPLFRRGRKAFSLAIKPWQDTRKWILSTVAWRHLWIINDRGKRVKCCIASVSQHPTNLTSRIWQVKKITFPVTVVMLVVPASYCEPGFMCIRAILIMCLIKALKCWCLSGGVKVYCWQTLLSRPYMRQLLLLATEQHDRLFIKNICYILQVAGKYTSSLFESNL